MPAPSSIGSRRTSYVRGAKIRRDSAVAKARSTVTKAPLSSRFNRPVYRKLRKPRSTTKVARNRSAITTLARQVKTLQQQRFGELQSQTMYCNIQAPDLPTPATPLAFLLNNFYPQPIYRGTVSNGMASYVQASTSLTKQTFQSDLDDQFEWNARRNTDIVSVVEYKPVYTRLKIRFRLAFNGTKLPTFLRVTVLKIRPYLTSKKLDVSRPMALGAYRNLAIQDFNPARNYFDRKYHTILTDKWMKVTFDEPAGETLVDRTCIISWRHSDKLLKPDLNAPSGEIFWSNVPVSDQLWVLISAGENSRVEAVEIGKFDTWRDPHGV